MSNNLFSNPTVKRKFPFAFDTYMEIVGPILDVQSAPQKQAATQRAIAMLEKRQSQLNALIANETRFLMAGAPSLI
jgi:hypothetical protein